MKFEIRKAQMEELGCIKPIFQYAREQMKKNGNPTQWGDSRPDPQLMVRDIENGNGYVLALDGEICGYFALIEGEDPTYKVIEDGAWLNEKAYGVIHRVASNGKCTGIMDKILQYCEKQIPNIRIDTHEDNHIMQHILEKSGYIRCGIIYVDDGTPRIAYQKDCISR